MGLIDHSARVMARTGDFVKAFASGTGYNGTAETTAMAEVPFCVAKFEHSLRTLVLLRCDEDWRPGRESVRLCHSGSTVEDRGTQREHSLSFPHVQQRTRGWPKSRRNHEVTEIKCPGGSTRTSGCDSYVTHASQAVSVASDNLAARHARVISWHVWRSSADSLKHFRRVTLVVSNQKRIQHSQYSLYSLYRKISAVDGKGRALKFHDLLIYPHFILLFPAPHGEDRVLTAIILVVVHGRARRGMRTRLREPWRGGIGRGRGKIDLIGGGSDGG